MTTSKPQDIKRAVRERYAARATGAISACCGPAEAAPPTPARGVYLGADLSGLPGEVLLASAGCGNPTALADLKSGETVVDLGSGGGIDCFLAGRAVGPSGHVIGVDMTPQMIELARSNAQRLKAANVEFRQGEIEALPVQDGTADVIISNCVVCLSPDKDAVFREAFRVLRPGGRLHISDMMLVGDLPQAIKDDPKRWAECVGGAEPKEEYLARLGKAGFQRVSVKEERRYSSEPGLEALRSVYVRAVKSLNG
ncbi:MAG: arsenite methyltransferase [Chloroflexi bacterium]|nr:arsenite methyltransferase [Chloroflexota bacterium]